MSCFLFSQVVVFTESCLATSVFACLGEAIDKTMAIVFAMVMTTTPVKVKMKIATE